MTSIEGFSVSAPESQLVCSESLYVSQLESLSKVLQLMKAAEASDLSKTVCLMLTLHRRLALALQTATPYVLPVMMRFLPHFHIGTYSRVVCIHHHFPLSISSFRFPIRNDV